MHGARFAFFPALPPLLVSRVLALDVPLLQSAKQGLPPLATSASRLLLSPPLASDSNKQRTGLLRRWALRGGARGKEERARARQRASENPWQCRPPFRAGWTSFSTALQSDVLLSGQKSARPHFCSGPRRDRTDDKGQGASNVGARRLTQVANSAPRAQPPSLPSSRRRKAALYCYIKGQHVAGAHGDVAKRREEAGKRSGLGKLQGR